MFRMVDYCTVCLLCQAFPYGAGCSGKRNSYLDQRGRRMNQINWDDFEKVELRVGTIVEAELFPQAKRPAYKLRVDFGEQVGLKRASAQITDLYELDELVGKQVVGVVNFPPKQIGPFMSECLITGFVQDNGSVVLTVPDKPVRNGLRLA